MSRHMACFTGGLYFFFSSSKSLTGIQGWMCENAIRGCCCVCGKHIKIMDMSSESGGFIGMRAARKRGEILWLSEEGK